MQRKLIVAVMVLACLAAGSFVLGQVPVQAQLPGGGVSASTVAPVTGAGYTRKLPPPAGSVKPASPDPNYRPFTCSASVVNVSQTPGNQAESFVVVNPTNTNNLVAFSNIASGNSIFRGYSMNGGMTWTRGTVATNVACCDGQAVFDTFGNLFLVYINGNVNQIVVILSTDGGVTFTAPLTVGTGSIDQPSIAVGNGSVWVDWNSSGNMVARGAPVTGLGVFGPFNALQAIPSASGSFGGITVGPGPNGGKVMVTYMSPTSGQGPATIYANVDADGLGAGGFGPRITVTSTNVGGFDYIPAQSGRSIDAEPGLVWDSTGGPFNNRVYLVYTEEPVNESNDTEIYLRTSTDDGATWSAPVRVNDDPMGPIRSQFLPYIALDPTSGTVAIGWHDARNDNGVPGSGGTNNIPNDDSEYYASSSTDGGVTWAANTRLSGGFSNAADAGNGVDYGDYVGQSAYGGKFYAVWADNANCDGSNPDGTLHAFDLYIGILNLPGGGATPTATTTRTATPLAGSPTRTATATPANTATRTATPPANTATRTATSTSVPSASNTPVPTGTNTTVPSATNTTVATGTPTTPPVNTATPTTPPAATSTPTTPPVNTATPTTLPVNTDTPTAPPANTATATATACTINFSDVHPADYFYTPVTYLYCHGVISGYNDGTFRPYNNTTRSQMVKIVVLGFNKAITTPSGGAHTFTDVPASNPFFTVVETAAADGIVSGYTCGTAPAGPCDAQHRPYFLPYADVTRGQLAKIDVIAAGWALFNPTTPTFSDVPRNSTFYEVIETAVCHGVVSGYSDGTFRPYNNATRGQISKIVYLSIVNPPISCGP
ncbi:MAG: S-layer homology domain-containing protein [Chloroflexia bacterium]